MELRHWLSLMAAIGNLSLMVIAIAAGGGSPLARRLAAFCFALFAWNFAAPAYLILHVEAFLVVDAVFSALSPVLTLELLVSFADGPLHHTRARTGAWLAFGGLAATSLVGLVSRRVLDWLDHPSWAIWFGVAWLPTLVYIIVVLVRHLRGATHRRERSRTKTMLAALAVGGAFGTCDIIRGLGVPLPHPLGAIGTFAAAALITTVVVRFNVLERTVSPRFALLGVAMIVVFIAAYVVLFRMLSGRPVLQASAATVVTFVVVVAARAVSSWRRASDTTRNPPS